MPHEIHTASSRGHAHHGWLDTYHTFSFADYWNPKRMGFGALRVLNDDVIAPGTGFGMHPHDNMEIISLPIAGALLHRDDMGHTQTISAGEIQVMSAGTGIFHSEINPSEADQTRFLQIWIKPRNRGETPRYAKRALTTLHRKNRLYEVVSPQHEAGGLWIHQDAWLHLGDFDEGTTETYVLKSPENGVYLFCIEGNLEASGQTLGSRDGLAVSGERQIHITATSAATFLTMEVPLHTEKEF